MIYFHGNAATRAASNRVRTARHLTDLGANFVIIDYRGFADSTRSPPPSEQGLLVDARRAWDFVHVEKRVAADRIAIMGQSLGTGVSAGLAGKLAKEGAAYRVPSGRSGVSPAPRCRVHSPCVTVLLHVATTGPRRNHSAGSDPCRALLLHRGPVGNVQARCGSAFSPAIRRKRERT